jgi:hypothetical protein
LILQINKIHREATLFLLIETPQHRRNLWALKCQRICSKEAQILCCQGLNLGNHRTLWNPLIKAQHQNKSKRETLKLKVGKGILKRGTFLDLEVLTKGFLKTAERDQSQEKQESSFLKMKIYQKLTSIFKRQIKVLWTSINNQ